MKPFKYIISGGGTGGHIYPAIAIADAIKAKQPEAKIVFVGAYGKMEMEKVPQAGYRIHGIWISGLQRAQLWRNVLFPIKLAVSLVQAFVLWLRYRPNVLIGTGGFASGPMLFVGRLLGSKTLIQEQNSYPGITNKLLSKNTNAIAVAYAGMERYFPAQKIHFTGNPVRQNLLDKSIEKTNALHHFDLATNKKTLVIIGGSLGAQKINELIAAQLPFFESQGIQLLWQCGRLYYERYKGLSSENVKVHAFITEMHLLYAAADIIISRAGASSISELCLVGKPTLFIPSPNVAENHQFHNANALVEEEAAVLVEEKKLAEAFEASFTALLNDEKRQKSLSENMKKLAKPTATAAIVNCIENLNQGNE